MKSVKLPLPFIVQTENNATRSIGQISEVKYFNESVLLVLSVCLGLTGTHCHISLRPVVQDGADMPSVQNGDK